MGSSRDGFAVEAGDSYDRAMGCTPQDSQTRSTRPRWTAALLALAWCVLVGSTPAAIGQVSYELAEDEWQVREAPDLDTPEGELQTVRRLIAEDQPKRAQKLAERWLEAHGDHPLRPEAMLLLGDAKVADRDFYQSLFDYEKLIRAYPQSEQYQTALEREFEIARLFVTGTKRKQWGLRILPADGEGEELLIRIQERSPGSPLGERASLLLADYYFGEGQMGLATDAYDLFLMNYPRSTKREWAMLRLIQASLARFRGPGFDKTGLLDARVRLDTYREEFPAAAERIGATALLARIDESLARHAMVTAKWYASRGEMASAAYLYRRVVAEHPRTAAAAEALERFERIRGEVDLTGLPAGTQPDEEQQRELAPIDIREPGDANTTGDAGEDGP